MTLVPSLSQSALEIHSRTLLHCNLKEKSLSRVASGSFELRVQVCFVLCCVIVRRSVDNQKSCLGQLGHPCTSVGSLYARVTFPEHPQSWNYVLTVLHYEYRRNSAQSMRNRPPFISRLNYLRAPIRWRTGEGHMSGGGVIERAWENYTREGGKQGVRGATNVYTCTPLDNHYWADSWKRRMQKQQQPCCGFLASGSVKDADK